MDLNAYETSCVAKQNPHLYSLNISHITCKKIFHKLRIYIVKYLLIDNTMQGEFYKCGFPLVMEFTLCLHSLWEKEGYPSLMD